jgi:hypothetical protein
VILSRSSIAFSKRYVPFAVYVAVQEVSRKRSG